MQQKQRVDWIDMMRGIAMICVVFGHIPGGGYLSQFVYLFHVPAFFFISGYLFDASKKPDTFLHSRAVGLLVPFLLFGVTTIILNGILHALSGQPYHLFLLIRDMLLQVRFTNSRIWFLPCLFLTEIVTYAVMQFSTKKIKYLIFGIMIALGWVNALVWKFNLPWYPDTAAIAISFLLAGYICKQKFLLQRLRPMYGIVIFSVIDLFILSLNINKGYVVDMIQNRFGNPVSFYMGAFAGIGLLYCLSRLGTSQWITYVGKNTVAFLCLNSIGIKISTKIVQAFASAFKIECFQNVNFISAATITALTLLALTIASRIIERFFPVYIGRAEFRTAEQTRK